MNRTTDSCKLIRRILPSIGPIIFRNVFILVNLVLGSVVVLLFVFDDRQSGAFIGAILIINTIVAVFQDIRARYELERLHMFTAATVTRVKQDGAEERVLAEEIKKGDRLKIKLGDQLPCDGLLILSEHLEVSEALVTGESDTFARETGSTLIAGAIVTSGRGIALMQSDFADSRLALMTTEMKKYSVSPSSIQTAVASFIKYSGYILLLSIVFVALRGWYLHVAPDATVLTIGALASMFVPQGLVVVITLLFAIGAASYAKRHVLFQEINATEKLGRIKNLCMDKTGTLTDTILNVNRMYTGTGVSKELAKSLMSAYIAGSGDSSETITAVERYVGHGEHSNNCKISDALSFSSWRKYGGVQVTGAEFTGTVLVGTPDIFLPRLQSDEEKSWLNELLATHENTGERVLCAVYSASPAIPRNLSENSDTFSLLTLFIFNTAFRAGAEGAVKFFQDRGIRIRIISGDRTATVSAVALQAGVHGAERAVAGKEMELWSESDFAKKADNYNVFAQVMPEQKVQLIEAFKVNGFTAMVGDGVNDALAIKKSDLGIAMFDSVPVTRQLADVILMHNSFTDLPGAVILADNFIHRIELSAGVYITKSVTGLGLFIILSSFGFAFPLLPLNITFMNYFIVGIPGILIMYWAIWPMGKVAPAAGRTFGARIMPFVAFSGIVEALAITIIFFLSPSYLQSSQSNTLVMFAMILSSFTFLYLAPKAFGEALTRTQKIQLAGLALLEVAAIYVLLQIPVVIKFFTITLPLPPVSYVGIVFIVLIVSACVQYAGLQKFFVKQK